MEKLFSTRPKIVGEKAEAVRNGEIDKITVYFNRFSDE